ncbi:MAG: hypothetical protein ABIR96_10705 [Bdellovibrionota bacterium]
MKVFSVKLRTLLLVASGALAFPSLAFNVGFNQGWWKDNYGGQWIDPNYSPAEVRRILDLAQDAGSKTLRIWLFEGQDPHALVWKNDLVAGLHPDFLRNFEDFLMAAKERHIQVYPTLFDGNVLRTVKGGLRNRWWNIMNGKFGARDAFQKNALAPVLALLYRADLRPGIFGIDVMNEIDAAVVGGKFEKSWASANALSCGTRDFIRTRRAGQSAIPVTTSVGWPWIPFFSRGAANLILDPNPHPSCVDFWDLHFYNNSGSIPNCEKIAKVSRDYGKKMYLGEFGQLSKLFSDSMQSKVTKNFIQNAKACGFSGALAWRLSDNRSGESSELRFTHEIAGKMRPAFDVIRKWNFAGR